MTDDNADAESTGTATTTASNSPPTMAGSSTPWTYPQPGSSNWSEDQIQAEAAKLSAKSSVMVPLLIAESVETRPSRWFSSFGTFGKGKENKKVKYTKLEPENEDAAEMEEETAL
jgi:hypothetical protein